LIRTIYLYLFTIVGMVLLVIGTVGFIDMGLKATIFNKADEPQRIQQKFYGGAPVPFPADKMQLASDDTKLTDDERAAIKQWIVEYKLWQEESAKIDYVASERQRSAATNLAMLIVGVPLYLYHWTLIKKEMQQRAAVSKTPDKVTG
jgi:hypothetical protein